MQIFFSVMPICLTMFIVKLGGSVITHKSQECSFRVDIMDGLAQRIQQTGKEMILVHGAGSFGHILAKQYKLNDGFQSDNQLQGFSLTHARVQELNSLVLQSLHSHDIPAVSLPPHAITLLNNHVLEQMEYAIFSEYLQRGFVPVTFGDVVLDTALRLSICSGDLLVRALAERFQPEKVVFVVDVDGLYTSNPKQDADAEFIETITRDDLERLTTKADAQADVTGGMKGKLDTIKTISSFGVDTVVVNGNKPDRVYDVLMNTPCRATTVVGEPP
jgi:isopentenyl phosphate kinase